MDTRIYHDITATMFTFVVCYTFQSFHWSQEARNLLLWNPGPADSPDTPLDFLQLSGQAWTWRGWSNQDQSGKHFRQVNRQTTWHWKQLANHGKAHGPHAQSIFMVDNALGTSVSGPLPEGIEERCPPRVRRVLFWHALKTFCICEVLLWPADHS